MAPQLNSQSSSLLTINLDAIADNYKFLEREVSPAQLAAVVKANAYGLGVERIAASLNNLGCNTFFVATLEEGLQLRRILPQVGIHVFNGVLPGWPDEMIQFELQPVLNSLEQVDIWLKRTENLIKPLWADLHVDTGMSRLGLSAEEAIQFLETPALSKAINLDVLLSHLAIANIPEHNMNMDQLKKFKMLRTKFNPTRGSLAASSGIFLGSAYHFDLVRSGIALYGGNPVPGQPNPMKKAVKLQGRILQVRSVDTPQTVGYGASHQVSGPARIATVSTGYADGYPRSLGNIGKVWIGDHEAPVVGHISMDLTTVDVSKIPERLARMGALVDFIGPAQSIDLIASTAETIDYEMLTRLGTRVQRDYVGGN